jgi:micrococcal nuclease
MKVRLEGVDCPESHQDYGTKAKQFTSDLVFGKEVKVVAKEKDRYGRTVGTVFVDEQNLNLSLVKAGLAWHYKQYSKDETLAQAETDARAAKIGLWSVPDPTPPWDFRRGGSKSSATNKPAEKVTQQVTKQSKETLYWLNTSSNVRHNSSCSNYMKTKAGRACSKDEGKACGICGG